MNKQLLYATLALIVVVSSLTVAFGLTETWTHTISWETTNKSFTVYHDSTLEEEWASGESIELGTLDVGDTVVQNYYVKNTGNMAITVTASAVTSVATVEWDPESATIPVGLSKTFTLILTITGPGSCTVSFGGA